MPKASLLCTRAADTSSSSEEEVYRRRISPSDYERAQRMYWDPIECANPPPPKKCSKLKKWISSNWIGLLFCAIGFFMGCCHSLHGPFLPPQFLKEQVNIREYSYVFGASEGVVFFCCAVFGYQIYFIYSKLGAASGVALMGVSIMLYGVLEWCPYHSFLKMACITRGVEAIGRSLFFVALFGYLILKYEVYFTLISAYVCIAFTVGMLFGSSIGGVIYWLLGYGATHIIFGGALLFNLYTIYQIPELNEVMVRHNRDIISGVPQGFVLTFLEMCTEGTIISVLLCTFTSMVSYSFLVIALGYHALQHSINKYWIAVAFICHNFALVVVTLILVQVRLHLQRFYHTTGSSTTLQFYHKTGYGVGAILCTVGIAVINHVAGYVNEWTTVLMLAGATIHGLGMTNLVLTFSDVVEISVNEGFAQNIGTYRVTCMWWIVLATLGNITGTVGGAVLVDEYGFHVAAYLPMALNTFTVFVCSCVGLNRFCGCCELICEEDPYLHQPLLRGTYKIQREMERQRIAEDRARAAILMAQPRMTEAPDQPPKSPEGPSPEPIADRKEFQVPLPQYTIPVAFVEFRKPGHRRGRKTTVADEPLPGPSGTSVPSSSESTVPEPQIQLIGLPEIVEPEGQKIPKVSEPVPEPEGQPIPTIPESGEENAAVGSLPSSVASTTSQISESMYYQSFDLEKSGKVTFDIESQPGDSFDHLGTKPKSQLSDIEERSTPTSEVSIPMATLSSSNDNQLKKDEVPKK